MSEDGPIKAYLGSYELGTSDLVIPLATLREAERVLDAERDRRTTAAAEAEAAAAIERATKRGWWRKLREMFRRR
jgi:hypothetical protein